MRPSLPRKRCFGPTMAHIEILAKADGITFASGATKPEASATAVCGRIQVHVLLKGILDFDEERKRLRKELAKMEKDIGGSRKKLSNEGFLKKAPPEVVEEVRAKVDATVPQVRKTPGTPSIIRGNR